MANHKSRPNLSNLFYLLLTSAVWFTIGWTLRGWRTSPEILLIEKARRHLLNEHPSNLNSTRELTQAAIRGMLSLTGDPYAALFDPVVSQRFMNDFTGRSGAVGIRGDLQNGALVVVELTPGDPAERSGIQMGDIIKEVDGYKFSSRTTEIEASMLIRGPVGEAAHFVVQRGDETLEFNPVRKERVVISAKMLEGNIAYLEQRRFTANADTEVKSRLLEVLAQNPRGLIWDLRDNAGGSMETARNVLSCFIKEGLLFSAELKGGERKPYMASGDAIAPDIPLVVLIGKETYSSAEASAIAVHETRRGTLIGGLTFGKGSVQTTVSLGEGHMLHFTIARWFSPQGEWLENRGVTPDFSVVDDPATPTDEILKFALDYLIQGQ
jgi:carboxyl-terminal processing protease